MRGTRGVVELGQRSVLTAKDIEQTNKMYKCKKCGRQIDASNWISTIDQNMSRRNQLCEVLLIAVVDLT